MAHGDHAIEEGFHGDVSGMSLSDVVQLNDTNRFSGCITVQQGSSTGRIFFREGKIIHAEQGGKTGEDAFYDILEWRSGHFSLQPNVSTTSHSIDKPTQFLLMEAHRLMDERRAGRSAPSAPPPAAPAAPARASGGAVERTRAVPGVAYAVLLTREGAALQDGSFDAAALAGRAAYLTLMGTQIGASLGAGDVRSVALHGKAQHVLVLAGKNHDLALAADASRPLGAVEAEVLKALGAST
jgi:predicted regulator of Ras-like GTPase activity (Roadblock/LC7/MglB family)